MKLSNQNIADVIKKIEKFFESVNVSTKDKIKICILIEEALLRHQEKFGEDKNFELVTKKWFGTPKILIRIKGEPYNPLEDNSEENIFSESVMQNLLNYEQAKVIYRYENSCNEITAVANKEIKNLKIPGGNTTVAICLAIISGLIMQNFSEPTQNIIAGKFISPILDKLFGAIIAVNIPLIFISIVASICALENVSVLHDLNAKVFKRFFAILFLVAISTVFVSAIFFPILNFNFGGQISSNNFSGMQKIFDLLLNIIPQNIVSPFLEKEILQIVILAMLTGICITILGERVQGIKNFIFDLQKIVLTMVSIVFKIMPVIIFLCIFKITLQGFMSEILNVWKVVFAQYFIYIFLILPFLLKNYFLHGVKILDFLKKNYPAFLISFTTGSGSASMPKNIEICSEELKIPKNLCDFYLPLSHSLCPAATVVSLIVYTFFAAPVQWIMRDCDLLDFYYKVKVSANK